MKFNTEQSIDPFTVGEFCYTTSQTVCSLFFLEWVSELWTRIKHSCLQA